MAAFVLDSVPIVPHRVRGPYRTCGVSANGRCASREPLLTKRPMLSGQGGEPEGVALPGGYRLSRGLLPRGGRWCISHLEDHRAYRLFHQTVADTEMPSAIRR